MIIISSLDFFFGCGVVGGFAWGGSPGFPTGVIGVEGIGFATEEIP